MERRGFRGFCVSQKNATRNREEHEEETRRLFFVCSSSLRASKLPLKAVFFTELYQPSGSRSAAVPRSPFDTVVT
jgi:hypothetical protein